ncbi:MAG TPA: hypothetical protein VNA20_10885 [Frankiaceae bacterium]|nr:hypothetical protein [Frankiaceae bacterium]
MRRLLAAALAAPLAAALAGPATAAGSTHDGRCEFQPFNQNEVTGSGFGGFLYAAVTLRSDDVAANPVTATVTCSLVVDGHTAAQRAATGTGAVVVIGYDTPPWGDRFEVCTVVDFADATPTATECVPWEPEQIPPQVVVEEVGEALDRISNLVWRLVDPILCPLLASLAPVDGPLVINEQGDVYLDGEPVWDCPPYDAEWERR